MHPFRGPRVFYSRPVFNPQNPREVAFLKTDQQDETVTGLWKMNLDTRQQTQIRAGRDLILQVRWNTRGWLALSKDDQIWKVKSTGDSLTQLTYGVPHYQPQWHPDGRRLVCAKSGLTAADQGLVFLDHKGSTPTTPAEPLKRGYAEEWSPDGQKLLIQHGEGTAYGMGVYYPATNRAELLVPVDMSTARGSIGGAAWLPDSRSFVWCNGHGLYKTDLATRRTITLDTGCGSRLYLHPSVSRDGRTLIVERTDRRAEDEGKTIYSETTLWTMDLDGGNKRRVDF